MNCMCIWLPEVWQQLEWTVSVNIRFCCVRHFAAFNFSFANCLMSCYTLGQGRRVLLNLGEITGKKALVSTADSGRRGGRGHLGGSSSAPLLCSRPLQAKAEQRHLSRLAFSAWVCLWLRGPGANLNNVHLIDFHIIYKVLLKFLVLLLGLIWPLGLWRNKGIIWACKSRGRPTGDWEEKENVLLVVVVGRGGGSEELSRLRFLAQGGEGAI